MDKQEKLEQIVGTGELPPCLLRRAQNLLDQGEDVAIAAILALIPRQFVAKLPDCQEEVDLSEAEPVDEPVEGEPPAEDAPVDNPQPDGDEAVAAMVPTLEEGGIDGDVIEAMLAAGLVTMEDVHAHPDLTSIKGIGEATRNKILAL